VGAPLDGRVKARIFALHLEHPSLGVRRVAAELLAETGVRVSREAVRKLWRSPPPESELAAGVVDPAPAEPPGPVALSAVLPMTEADHAAMDREPGWLV
jgi:hypothetical protein